MVLYRVGCSEPQALTQLREDQNPDERYQKTRYICFNPKVGLGRTFLEPSFRCAAAGHHHGRAVRREQRVDPGLTAIQDCHRLESEATHPLSRSASAGNSLFVSVGSDAIGYVATRSGPTALEAGSCVDSRLRRLPWACQMLRSEARA